MSAPAGAPIRVALADDHTLFREGIRKLISTDPGFELVGEAATGDGAVALAVEYWPDVLLLDVEMPGTGAAAVIGQVRRFCPRTRIIVLTMHDDAAVMRDLLESGAAAYLTKAVLWDELGAAVRSVYQGSQTVLLSVSRRTLGLFGEYRSRTTNGPAPLTAREREILRLLADGLSNAKIAAELYVTPATVKRHLTNIYAKLNAVSRVDAVRKATAARLIVAEEEPEVR